VESMGGRVLASGPVPCQNAILMIQNAVLAEGQGRSPEAQRLLEAALQVIGRCGTTSRPRVADIVAAAGLSNDAFYRHFGSKEALVSAILDDGAKRLYSYLARRMWQAATPEEQVRRWLDGVLSQADEQVAAITRAVLWNGGGVSEGMAAGRHYAAAPLATLLHEPFRALGSRAPAVDASLVAHAALGRMSDHLWAGTAPSDDETAHMAGFFLAAVRAG
jgi:AcrR family transcriptional regulator